MVLVLALLGFVAIVYIYGMSGYWILHKMNVPGAKPLPYVGNLRDLAKSGGVHLGTLQYYKKYGKVFSLCIGRQVSIAIADPEMIKQIMVKDFHNFTNHFNAFPLPKRQKGLFTSQDENWKRIRSTLTPVFTSGKLKVMVPLIEKSCNTLVDKIGDIADTGKYSTMETSAIYICFFFYDPYTAILMCNI
jgi:cytochrome P450